MENKIGKFILELRNERGMTQNDLADLIPVTRQAVSRWEQGKSIPDSYTLMILSDLFDVTINELLNGERNVKDEEVNMEKIALEIIDENISKEKKIKKVTIISVIVIIALILGFLLYYFFATYDSVKIYTINGESDNFISDDGLMIVTKQKIYIKLGSLQYDDLDVDKVRVFYRSKDEEKLLLEDERGDYLIIDYYGYDEYLSYDNIDILTNNLYLDIYYNDDKNEKMKLDVNLDMINTKVVFDKEVLIGDEIDEEKERTVFKENSDYAERIRSAMIEKGERIDDIYVLKIENNIEISYDVEGDFIILNFYNDNYRIYLRWSLLDLDSYLYRKFINDEFVEEKFIKDVSMNDDEEIEKFNQLNNYINKYVLEESN